MSESKAVITAAHTFTTADGTVLTKGDIEFLMACVANTTSGHLVIDQNKVAAALNMKNPKSVGNKVSQIKKKFGFPITCSAKAAAPGSGGAGVSKAPDPVVFKFPNTNRVKKPAFAITGIRNKGVKKVKKEEDEEDAEREDEQDAVSGAEEEKAMVSSPLSVKEPKLSTPELEEAVFGKADTEEEEEQEEQDEV